jgi:hypothetical protein
MTLLKPILGLLPAAYLIAVGVWVEADAATPVMVLSPGKLLEFDFSRSPNGGVPAGTFNNFGFVLDLNRPMQKPAVRSGQPQREVSASFDYADCNPNQQAQLEQSVSRLGPGTAAFVDYVDIDMIPIKQKDLIWNGGVCYGFRTATGWHWRLTSIPLTYDAAANLVRGRIWLKQPDVDALKLVFDYSVPTQSVRAVRVTTQPDSIDIVK